MEHLFDDILEKNEQIIKIIKPSKSRYTKAMFAPFIIPIFWPHLILILVVTLFTFPFIYMHGYKNLYYAYTNKRLIVRKGMIGVDYRSLDFKNITASSVAVDLFDKGKKATTGTISFSSPTSSIKFQYVENPYDLLREIREHIDSINENANSENN
ncbi:MAG: PH domain-containing protein [Clostridia bacterium]|nr:PH domain-containing protein [Clostridia bacterium]